MELAMIGFGQDGLEHGDPPGAGWPSSYRLCAESPSAIEAAGKTAPKVPASLEEAVKKLKAPRIAVDHGACRTADR